MNSQNSLDLSYLSQGRESLSPMRIKQVFGQDNKGTRPLTPHQGIRADCWR